MLGEASFSAPVPASAILSLCLPLELSSLPQADSVRAAAAVSVSTARRMGRRFTVGSR
ncbi:hypothetical protein STAFG_7743 [Streptomyces afghaniensis 772]|uniref:Uncharacterized protein n=1 Tax=Streptomyces afghaniensis 772 TaxID=1283301 RepID=S4MFC7_9ACTN|nr:hypothetical protein STAFG_7743 [Streptomyces afghaniensis 772]